MKNLSLPLGVAGGVLAASLYYNKRKREEESLPYGVYAVAGAGIVGNAVQYVRNSNAVRNLGAGFVAAKASARLYMAQAGQLQHNLAQADAKFGALDTSYQELQARQSAETLQRLKEDGEFMEYANKKMGETEERLKKELEEVKDEFKELRREDEDDMKSLRQRLKEQIMRFGQEEEFKKSQEFIPPVLPWGDKTFTDVFVVAPVELKMPIMAPLQLVERPPEGLIPQGPLQMSINTGLDLKAITEFDFSQVEIPVAQEIPVAPAFDMDEFVAAPPMEFGFSLTPSVLTEAYVNQQVDALLAIELDLEERQRAREEKRAQEANMEKIKERIQQQRERVEKSLPPRPPSPTRPINRMEEEKLYVAQYSEWAEYIDIPDYETFKQFHHFYASQMAQLNSNALRAEAKERMTQARQRDQLLAQKREERRKIMAREKELQKEVRKERLREQVIKNWQKKQNPLTS